MFTFWFDLNPPRVRAVDLRAVGQVRQQCKEIAAGLVNKNHLFVLGKGYGEPVAYEVGPPPCIVRLRCGTPLFVNARCIVFCFETEAAYNPPRFYRGGNDKNTDIRMDI